MGDFFRSQRARAQQDRLGAAQVDHGAFDATLAGAGRYQPRDLSPEPLQHMVRQRGRDEPGRIGAGRRHRDARRPQQGPRHRVGRHPQGDRVPSRGDTGVDFSPVGQHQGQRPRPESLGQQFGAVGPGVAEISGTFRIGYMNNQRVGAGTALGGVQPVDRLRGQRAGAQPVHRLGGEGHQVTGGQRPGRLGQVARGGVFRVNGPDGGHRFKSGRTAGLPRRETRARGFAGTACPSSPPFPAGPIG